MSEKLINIKAEDVNIVEKNCLFSRRQADALRRIVAPNSDPFSDQEFQKIARDAFKDEMQNSEPHKLVIHISQNN